MGRGMTLTKIEFLHCNAHGHPVGLSNMMARHGDEVVAKARELYADGLSYKAVGKALGIPWPTIQSWVGKSGNQRRNVPAVRITARRQKEKKTA